MKLPAETSVSILGAGYFQPIADLVDRSLKWPATKRNAVKALHYDNCYSVSIVLLLVAALESYATRLRYFHGAPPKGKAGTVAKYIKHVFPGFRMVKALTEVFVLRDAIFHNHLWEVEFTWRPMTLKSATLVPYKEDAKFNAVVNPATRRTRNLRLHVVPTRVDRRDALKVFDVVWKTLLFLERKDRNYCYVSAQNVAFRGRMQPFVGLREVLANAL
jgi:hypothetical protein